jgi:hypothetical protein
MSNVTSTFRPSPTVGDTSGDAFFKEAQTVTTPGVTQTIISEVVPTGKTVNILKVDLSCRLEGRFDVKIDSLIIGSGRTSPGSPNAVFDWRPFREAQTGETIKIEFTAMSTRPATDVEAYLQGREL